MASNGTGFSQGIVNLAPGDTVNRYVALPHGAVLDGKDLTLTVTDSTPTLLTTSPTNGLHATVSSCPTAWTPGNRGRYLQRKPHRPAPQHTLEQPGHRGSCKTGTNAASTVLNLQISLVLPDQNETVTNGTPITGNIQGLSSALTWKFGETQRTATVTGS